MKVRSRSCQRRWREQPADRNGGSPVAKEARAQHWCPVGQTPPGRDPARAMPLGNPDWPPRLPDAVSTSEGSDGPTGCGGIGTLAYSRQNAAVFRLCFVLGRAGDLPCAEPAFFRLTRFFGIWSLSATCRDPAALASTANATSLTKRKAYRVASCAPALACVIFRAFRDAQLSCQLRAAKDEKHCNESFSRPACPSK